MVSLRRLADAKTNRHDIEEFSLAEVIAEVKQKFVVPLLDFLGTEDKRTRPAVTVGLQSFALRYQLS